MLPSQTTKPSSRRKHTFRRRRHRWMRPALLLGLGIVAVVVIWQVWPAGEDDPEAPAKKLTPAFVATNTDHPQPGSAARESRPREKPAAALADRRAAAVSPPAAPAKTVAAPPRQVPASADPIVKGPLVEAPVAPATSEPRATEPPPVVMGSRSAVPPPTMLDLPPAPVRRADELINAGRLVEARALLSRVLTGRLVPAEADAVRERLTRLNETMVFDRVVVPDDPYAMHYTIQSGDSLAKISRRLSLLADWRFVQRINGIDRPERIRVGQKIKLVTGPFHAIVHKRDYRLDLYMGESEERVYVCSFPVGLGRFNATPTGRFRVREHSKLINPEWTHPHTGQRYAADDPENPIGEYWIGLEGIEETNRDAAGYGIHGTVEPESIGQQASMGCVRMRHDDVAIVYEVLMEGISEVVIVE